jgi:hypothetical protein
MKKLGGRTTRMPAHPYQPLHFVEDKNRRMGTNGHDSFNYIAPVVKYAPPNFQPGPVYRSGLAAAIKNQPYMSSDMWIAGQTPNMPNYYTMQSGMTKQSSAGVAQSQAIMGQILMKRGSS